MHVQIMTFDGPRSPELVEASDRAGRERIAPLIAAGHPDLRDRLIGGFRAVGENGTECVVTFAHHPEAFRDLGQLAHRSLLAMSAPRLPNVPATSYCSTRAPVQGDVAPAPASR